MAATISFWSGSNRIENNGGSGLGFFGSNFGTSVLVGAWASRVFHTSADGTTQGPEGNSTQWVSATGVVLGAGGGSGIALTQVPNAQAALNIRFDNDTPVQVPTATVYFYDGTAIGNNPSGLSFKAFEIIHPAASQSPAILGSGDSSWQNVAGTGAPLSLCPSPGSGGLYAGNGSNSTYSSLRHDHFLGISVSPTTVGSKTAKMAVYVEYL